MHVMQELMLQRHHVWLSLEQIILHLCTHDLKSKLSPKTKAAITIAMFIVVLLTETGI